MVRFQIYCHMTKGSREHFFQVWWRHQYENARECRHPYELYLQLEDIEHRTTKVNRPQSNAIVEPLHRTLPDEHFRVGGRRTWFETIEEMQAVLDKYLVAYNRNRPHQGRRMNGRPPLAGVPGRRSRGPRNRQNRKTEGTKGRMSDPQPNRRHRGGGVR